MKYSYFLIIVFSLMFSADAQNLQEVAKFETPDPIGVPIGFGFAISNHGNYLIVGDLFEKLDVNGNNSINEAGAAYIYEKDMHGKWIFVQKIVASDRHENSNFGISVSIYNNTAIVGAYSQDYDATGGNAVNSSGGVYIYERSSNGSWNQVQKIVASDRRGVDLFGFDVALNDDYILVGAPNHDKIGTSTYDLAGAIYFFQKDSGGIWQEIQQFAASDISPKSEFGTSVHMHEGYAVIGAVQEEKDELGNNPIDLAGAAYIFKKGSDGNWSEIDKIVASDRAEEDRFGNDVSINGNYVIVGARAESDLVIRDDTYYEGAAYVYENDGNDNWVEVKKLMPSDRDNPIWFGSSVSVKDNTAIIGAPRDKYDASGNNLLGTAGSAYVFNRDENGVWTETQKIVPSDRAISDKFGWHSFIGDEEVFISTLSYRYGSFYVYKMDNGLDINYNSFEESLRIHPNPTSGNLSIDLGMFYDDVKVVITNSIGQKIYDKTSKFTSFINANIQNAKGLYFVTVSSSKGESATLKIIKE